MGDKLQVVFVADIFGITDAFIDLCQQIIAGLDQTLNIEYQMIGPYAKPLPSFNSEHEAYQYFTDHVGLAGYVGTISKQLSVKAERQIFVGFSVGGSAIWQLCSQQTPKQSQSVICFYSSQIRHLTQLTPKVSTRLILPRSESHFCITEFQNELRGKLTVTIEKSDFLHGFMNQLSTNYDSGGCQYYIKRLAELLSQIKP